MRFAGFRQLRSEHPFDRLLFDAGAFEFLGEAVLLVNRAEDPEILSPFHAPAVKTHDVGHNERQGGDRQSQ